FQSFLNKASQPQCSTTDNIEEQLRSLLQVLAMVRSIPWDGVTPQTITSVTGRAKDEAIDEILQELHRYYQSNSPKLSGETHERT
ncbi:hypothetical protein, partial [Pseudomonas cannabina]